MYRTFPRSFLVSALFSLLSWLPTVTSAQIASMRLPEGAIALAPTPDVRESAAIDPNLGLITNLIRSRVDGPIDLISRLDLQAHGKAQREYQKGYQLLLKKLFQPALEHLRAATSLYPKFVSAHNAIGLTYLALGKNEQARAEFAKAIQLDEHLPNSYFDLGYADLALKNYPAAEQALTRASSIAPLDLNLLAALTFTQYVNGHFAAAIETARRVHERDHTRDYALVYFFSASAWEAQKNFFQAEQELETLFKEDPQTPAAPEARRLMERLKNEAAQPPSAASGEVSVAQFPREMVRAPLNLPVHDKNLTPQSQNDISSGIFNHAQAYGSCPLVSSSAGNHNLFQRYSRSQSVSTKDDPIFRASANEVEVFFSATDHGKPVTNLTSNDLSISDNHRSPAAITSLRNESELPLRIGFVIDTSDSVASRFKFEKNTATSFLQTVATDPNDFAFLVGFSKTVLLFQEFTNDHKLITRSVGQLAASGSTALWDAVDFAIGKLAGRAECYPVARILVVISDGEDNSSGLTLNQIINHAQQAQVSIYTVGTRQEIDHSSIALAGEHALKRLADLTGGMALDAESLQSRKNGLTLQHVIRNRYFVSYKPDRFQRNGEFHPIEIDAQKDGHKLRVYARKGYFAAVTQDSAHF